MTAQVSFTADQDLKDRALEKAKIDGISLKTLFVYTMKAFVEGKIRLGIEMVDREPEVEELLFKDKGINAKAEKLAKLLKK